MSNRPVYRYPPRSHAYNCPCPRCAQCRRDRAASGDGWGIIIPLAIAALIFIWPYAVWHGCKYGGQDLSGCGASSEWVWNARSWVACGIWWGLLVSPFVIAGLAELGKRRPVPPKGRLRVEATPDRLPPPPPIVAPPACKHLHAIAIPSLIPGDPPVAWLCPQCDEQLDEEFGRLKRPCCGTQPGNLHWYSCPEAKVIL